MFCAILSGSSRLLVNSSTNMCWLAPLRPSLHPVIRVKVVRYSSTSGSCSGPGPKTGFQPVSLSERTINLAHQTTRRPSLHPVIQGMVVRYSSSLGSCSDPGPKTGSQPVSLSERTINLAHQTSYTSAKKPACMKSQTSPACPKAIRKTGEYRHVPEPMPIRKCTVEVLSKKCPKPKPVCPPPKKPPTMMEMVGKTIIFFIKAAIVGGLVLWQIDSGVWGDSDDSAKLFKEVEAKTRELLRMEPVNLEVQELPKTDHMYHNALVTWNRGVVMTFEVVTSTYGKIAGMLGLDPEKKD